MLDGVLWDPGTQDGSPLRPQPSSLCSGYPNSKNQLLPPRECVFTLEPNISDASVVWLHEVLTAAE